MNTALFTPVTVGQMALAHRVVMAPMTRSRAVRNNTPTTLMAEYYGQRASAALIITEATQISAQAQGYAWTPGLHSPGQIAAWKNVTDAVHKKGGKIFVQLWHTGRISHSALQPDNATPLAPSALKAEGMAFITDANGAPAFVPFETPQAMTQADIAQVVSDFSDAAANAMQAGFDGVEIHAANGYLLDQFLNTSSNQRDDEFGGSIENRARFTLQVVDAVVARIGAEKVGVRISPLGSFNSMAMNDPQELFGYLVGELDKKSLAYLHMISPRVQVGAEHADKMQVANQIIADVRKTFKGPLILAGGFDRDSAESVLRDGEADLIAFGKPFLANPDLPQRLQQRVPLNNADAQTFYGGDSKGYTDYPFLAV